MAAGPLQGVSGGQSIRGRYVWRDGASPSRYSRPKDCGGRKEDRKSTRLNSSHDQISYAVFCLKKKEHTSELQSRSDLVCRLLLEKKKSQRYTTYKIRSAVTSDNTAATVAMTATRRLQRDDLRC